MSRDSNETPIARIAAMNVHEATVAEFTRYLHAVAVPSTSAEEWMEAARDENPSNVEAWLVEHLAEEIKDFYRHAIHTPEALDWFRLSVWPKTASTYRQMGYTPASFVEARDRVDALDIACTDAVFLHIPAQFFTVGIPDDRILRYHAARITLPEAVNVWEPKAAAGEDIDTTLKAMAALISAADTEIANKDIW